MPEIDDEISRLLKSVTDHFDKEDKSTRERQIRHMRRLKFYWNNFSQIYWSEVARDYRIAGYNNSNDSGSEDYYDRPVNVFRAFLETIIAALSIQIPGISCVPGDADNPNDLSTAKAGDIIADQLYKHNNVIFMWLNALYVYCTEGMIACYTYPKEDKKYGTYEKPKYENENVESYVCPNCQQRIPDEIFSNAEMNEFSPDDDDAKLHNIIEEKGPVCPECAVELDPNLQKSKLIIPRLTGYTTKVKSRICMEVYGGLYVKIANYAKKQEDTPYLNFDYETHYSNALERYPKLRKSFPGGKNTGSNDDEYEQYGRVNTQYGGDTPEENVTIKNRWLRPAAFNILPDADYHKLKRKFPDGVKVVFVNNICAEYENECLDDCWTLSKNPMSDYLNHEPLGELLTNIQDIVNDLISLTLQTIEHGIEQTWADPAVVNFDGQRQIESMPGTLIAAKAVSSGKSIGDAFYTTKTASLSPEVFNFYRIVQELGQFVSGALPSLFGGANTAGSKTASEYAMSKGMALQRLQTPWKMMTIWWKEIFAKAIPAYMNILVEDEKIVRKNDQGKFENVFIRKAELDGQIGDVELEPNEKLPVTDEQQAEMMMQLMQLNNQEITQALMDPENISYFRKVVGIPQFKLPGEDDRQKQYEEINELINSIPINGIPDQAAIQESLAAGQPIQPTEEPSVPIDPDVDNHAVESSICRTWLVSDAGRLAKIENPDGYKNVLLHMKAHIMQIQQQMMQQQLSQMQAQQSESDSKPNSAVPAKKAKQAETVNGANDARQPIGS